MQTPFESQLRDESGFTLIEVLLAMVLSLIVALGISQMLVTSAVQETQTRLKQEFYSTRQQQLYERKIGAAPSTP